MGRSHDWRVHCRFAGRGETGTAGALAVAEEVVTTGTDSMGSTMPGGAAGEGGRGGDLLGRFDGPAMLGAGRRRPAVPSLDVASEVGVDDGEGVGVDEGEGRDGCEPAEDRPEVARTEVAYSCQRRTNSSYQTLSSEAVGATIFTDHQDWWTPGSPGITERCVDEHVSQLQSSGS